jgi:hypothetical protein
MRRTFVLAAAATCTAIASAISGAGAQTTQPVYTPPLRGAPDVRVGGGTRGESTGEFILGVLAPRSVGWTSQEQPTLYWFVSRRADSDVLLTIVADESNETVLKSRIPGPVAAGINSFKLAGTTARLALDVDYQWTVTVANSATEPSRNPAASGMIKRVSRSALPDGTADSAALARAGLWYDAIDVLGRAIDARPTDPTLRSQRSALLNQLGLKEAARFDAARN